MSDSYVTSKPRVTDRKARPSFGHYDSNESKETVKERGIGFINRLKGGKKRRSGTKDDLGDDSPTSPFGFQPPNMPFAHPNGSDSSIDRPSSTSTVSEFDRMFRPRGLLHPGPSSKILMFFVTTNSKQFTLVNLTEATDADMVRKMICHSVGIEDWESAMIYLTQVGQSEHGMFVQPINSYICFCCFPSSFVPSSNHGRYCDYLLTVA